MIINYKWPNNSEMGSKIQKALKLILFTLEIKFDSFSH